MNVVLPAILLDAVHARSAFARLIASAAHALQAWRHSRRAAREHIALLELTEHTMNDIGAPEWLKARARDFRAEQATRRDLERQGLAFWQQPW